MTTKADEKESQEKPRPVKTIRNGAIAANIWKRQTPTGFEYLDFSLSRSWKLKDGQREGYSSSYFEQNRDALIDVITRAADFIRTQSPETLPIDEEGEVSASSVRAAAQSQARTRAEGSATT